MIETKRLILKPLTYSQLQKYLAVDNSLETELGLKNSARTLSAELREALQQTILPNVADSNKNFLFCTLWTAIWKTEKTMIGDICIVGEPNAEGEIEIGYGTYDEFRGRGFMKEAVAGMVRWAKDQANVSAIIAGTAKSNLASFAILEWNNFEKVGETETMFNWRLTW